MKLVEFFARNEIDLDLKAQTKEEALQEMVDLLDVGEKSAELYGLLKKRENLGSTGIGKGVAIPHCRSLVVDRLRVVYGRKQGGLAFGAVDGKPVHHLFLIVAPPVEISNQYLPVLGKIAQFCKNPKNLARLDDVKSVEDFFEVVEQANV
ncbi:MAG TPA: PTS sugar transporter subunit IIA [Gemmatimonadota bacterium]|jgi:mannitol/fructose-specific phosphotransferase system IIA component (Ntr-type)|nr:PTS sugar transporter subunit IIA [Gemmatimonadota bacterium]